VKVLSPDCFNTFNFKQIDTIRFIFYFYISTYKNLEVRNYSLFPTKEHIKASN